jgi:hypothetical protein
VTYEDWLQGSMQIPPTQLIGEGQAVPSGQLGRRQNPEVALEQT